MTEDPIQYITDTTGNPTAVVIPIQLWRQILPHTEDSIETITEKVEDYCMNHAMDEAKTTPLLSREQAIAVLAE